MFSETLLSDEELAKRLAQGDTVRKISQKFEVKINTIHQRIRRSRALQEARDIGKQTRVQRRNQQTEVDRATGKSLRAIGEERGKTYEAIRLRELAAGLPRRKWGGARRGAGRKKE